MTWAEVAREADITVETLRALRRGKNEPSDLTKRGLDRALQWEPGGVQSILNGGSPRPVGSLPALTAELHGSATEPEDEEEDSPISAYLRSLLQQAHEQNRQTQEESRRQYEDLSARLDEQREMIKRLLEDRRGA